MNRILTLFVALFLSIHAFSAIVQRVEPLNWWVGMKNPNLQLLIYGQNIADYVPELTYSGVKITAIQKTGNKNYLFLNLTISPGTKPGFCEIKLKKGKLTETINYELRSREKGSANRKGFSSGDLIYQIMPDRFANGDLTNDNVTGHTDSCKRIIPDKRHGGDIQGIINHLDYISAMGYTALWLTPVLENNMPFTSYHGYAITDFYHVDPRFGNNELYRKLSDEAAKRGIKLIKDLVVNHCGTNWWLYKDMPSDDWFNNYPDFKICNFRGTTLFDPHSAESDARNMADGWFAQSMPDLNQQNPLVANYLIQNSIWWVEYAGLTGIRSDTHQYPDKYFVSEWAKRILTEYPNFNIVGEVWLTYPCMVAYWQKDAPNLDKYNSNLPTIMDFPLNFALRKAFSEGESWEGGMARLYDHFSQDFMMANTANIMLFADNHDMPRFYTMLNEKLDDYKLAMALLLTTRGIPQMYAGTEVLQTGDDKISHGLMRKDFPGGWADDKINAFTQNGLSNEQIEAQNYMKKIQNWRKTNEAVKTGSMKQFVPENAVYVYFRQKGDQQVMVILNNNTNNQTLSLARFDECLRGYNSGIEIISGTKINFTEKLEVKAKSAMIVEIN